MAGNPSRSFERAVALVARIRSVLILQQRPGGTIAKATSAVRAQPVRLPSRNLATADSLTNALQAFTPTSMGTFDHGDHGEKAV